VDKKGENSTLCGVVEDISQEVQIFQILLRDVGKNDAQAIISSCH
jgi:hypothetical protein